MGVRATHTFGAGASSLSDAETTAQGTRCNNADRQGVGVAREERAWAGEQKEYNLGRGRVRRKLGRERCVHAAAHEASLRI